MVERWKDGAGGDGKKHSQKAMARLGILIVLLDILIHMGMDQYLLIPV